MSGSKKILVDGNKRFKEFFEDAEIEAVKDIYCRIAYHKAQIQKLNDALDDFNRGDERSLIEFDKNGVIIHKFI